MNDNEVSDDVLPTSLSGSDVSDGLDRLMRARITPEMHMQCKVCWFVYDPEEGLPEFGIEPGHSLQRSPRGLDLPRVRPSQGELHSGRRLLTGAAGKRRIIKTHRASLTRRRPMHFLRCRELPFRLIR